MTPFCVLTKIYILFYSIRPQEVAYFFTMLSSAVSAVSEDDSLCVAAVDQEGGKAVRCGIAARRLTQTTRGGHFGDDDWNDVLARGELGLTGGDDLALLYLWNFGVDCECRNRGIATGVMRWLEERASSGDIPCGQVDALGLLVYRTNRPAISLYEKLGYRVVERYVDPRWQRSAERGNTGVERKLLMVKPLCGQQVSTL